MTAQQSDGISIVYVTVSDEAEAKMLAKKAVTARLCACANILSPITSIYEWQGELCESSERLLLMKTRQTQVHALIELIKDLHSYECPCIVSLPLGQSYEPFLSWVAQQTSS